MRLGDVKRHFGRSPAVDRRDAVYQSGSLFANHARCSPVGRPKLTALSCRRGQAWLAGRIVTSVQVLDMCLLYVTKAFLGRPQMCR